MTHAFLSYKREDEVRVARIARALEQSGVEVWWDRDLPDAQSFHVNIEKHLDAAACVIVVWSQGSVGPQGHYVRDEARRGLERAILVPVLIDRIKTLPLGFGEVQAIDLSRWKGDRRDPFFQDLLAAIRAKIEGTPAPKPKGAPARVARRLMYASVSGAGVALVSTFLTNAFEVTTKVCTVPGVQPGLSDLCGAVALGDRPSRAERLAWAARPAGSCEALKAHINRFPQGAYREEAVALLAARRRAYQDRWTTATRELALFAPAQGPSVANEAQAKAAALKRAQADAERLCRGFGAGTLFRFRAATPQAETWSCAPNGAGTVCGFDGRAACEVEERHQVESDHCGAG